MSTLHPEAETGLSQAEGSWWARYSMQGEQQVQRPEVRDSTVHLRTVSMPAAQHRKGRRCELGRGQEGPVCHPEDVTI